MSSPEIDVQFDPSDTEEVATFVENLGEYSAPKRQELQSYLDKPRANAVIDYVTDFEIAEAGSDGPETANIVRPDPGPGGPGGGTDGFVQSSNTKRVNVRRGRNGDGYILFSFDHKIEWEHNGDCVRDVKNRAFSRIRDSTWSFEGIIKEWIDIENDESDFKAHKQGEFTYIGGGHVPAFKATPWVTQKGTKHGVGIVLDCDRGT